MSGSVAYSLKWDKLDFRLVQLGSYIKSRLWTQLEVDPLFSQNNRNQVSSFDRSIGF